MPEQQNKSEESFLRGYDPSAYERPSTAVDTVIFTIRDEALHVLILKRSEHPFQGDWSLVGGYVDIHQDKGLEDTAKRKLQEKTGVKTPYLEQFETIGNATRDPRGWSITTVYFALLSSENIQLYPGQGAEEIKWSPVIDGAIQESLAFDHADILHRCVERLKSKVLYTSLPTYLMPDVFSLGELQKVYELILGNAIDHKSFRRRMLGAGILEETGQLRYGGRRPAMLYRLRKSQDPHFFVRNLEGIGKSGDF